MSLADYALGMGRAAAEALMVDRCTIRRRTGETVDPDTGDVTPTYTVLYSDQRCRAQSRGYWGERRDVGEADLIVLQIELQLPIAVTGLQVSNEVTIDASVHDPDLIGRVLRIKDLSHKSHATARRVMCLEVTG